MFDNRPNETQYFYTDLDTEGDQLQGSNSYAVTFPAGQTPPVKGFWSLTLYNDKHRSIPIRSTAFRWAPRVRRSSGAMTDR